MLSRIEHHFQEEKAARLSAEKRLASVMQAQQGADAYQPVISNGASDGLGLRTAVEADLLLAREGLEHLCQAIQGFQEMGVRASQAVARIDQFVSDLQTVFHGQATMPMQPGLASKSGNSAPLQPTRRCGGVSAAASLEGPSLQRTHADMRQAQSMQEYGHVVAARDGRDQADDMVLTESPQSFYSGPKSPEIALSPTGPPNVGSSQNGRIAKARQWSHAKLSNRAAIPRGGTNEIPVSCGLSSPKLTAL
ncbi:g4366 [Coccomyxa elongata]